MRTKIRTLIAICILGFIGFTNIYAIADNKKLVNTEVVTEKKVSLTAESLATEAAFFNLAEALTAREADVLIDKYATKQISLNENALVKPGYLNAAESFTALEADVEIEKYAEKLLSLEKSKIGK